MIADNIWLIMSISFIEITSHIFLVLSVIHRTLVGAQRLETVVLFVIFQVGPDLFPYVFMEVVLKRCMHITLE